MYCATTRSLSLIWSKLRTSGPATTSKVRPSAAFNVRLRVAGSIAVTTTETFTACAAATRPG